MLRTQLMAILNTTPDSFYEGSRAATVSDAIDRALTFERDGADILDIGGESTRPGAPPVDEEEELRRVIPVIEGLQGKLTIPISIDTTKPNIARAAIEAGARFLNDISGFSNPEMVMLAAESKLDICVMHMHGTPKTMQVDLPHYEGGVVSSLLHWFEKRVDQLTREGVNPKQIAIDPGIGFGKTVADNLEIIHNLHLFKKLGFRVLLGASRKSFLSKILGKQAPELLPATLAVSTLAIEQDIDILRVHDVKEHRSIIDFMKAYHLNSPNL